MNCTELQELAASHALGLLDAADVARLAAELERNPDQKAEVAKFLDAAAALASAAAPQVTPPPELRNKILDQIRNRPQAVVGAAAPPVPEGFRFVLNDNSGWQPGPLPGFRVKQLSVSRDMGYHVLLAELSPGARFPEHDHKSSEELFIVSGHLQTEGRLLGPGDFLHAEPGSHHHELVSPDGCIALLIERSPVPA
jgi:anti-sigma factor ChrR (cupin superfamily)